MKLFFYAPTVTEGLPELISALGATRLSRHDGMNFLVKGKVFEPEQGSAIICWGHHVPAIPEVKVINANTRFQDVAGINKYLYKHPKHILVPEFGFYPSLQVYERELLSAKNGMGSLGGYPCKHIPSYFTTGISHVFRTRVHVVGTELLEATRLKLAEAPAPCKIPTGKLAERITNIFKEVKLDFGEVTVFRSGSNADRTVLHKVITNPKLDAHMVNVYAKHLDIFIKSPSLAATIIPTEQDNEEL